jgi:hypothetical protein
MTVAVPLEELETVREFDWFSALPAETAEALDKVLDFVARFEPQPLPSLEAEGPVMAGELSEIRLRDSGLVMVDLIRLNDRVYVPETVEAVSEFDGVIHEAGNGNRLTAEDVEAIAQRLERHAPTIGAAGMWHASSGSQHGKSLDGATLSDAMTDCARLLRFLGEILAGDPLERACDGIASLTREADAKGGGLIVHFEEPGQSWRLAQLLQSRLMAGDKVEDPRA